ncbi:MAG: hypothetical protein WCP15_00295 [bacterium]
MSKKKIIICDYPSKYTFPSFGFGSAEKRIWSFAKTLSNTELFEVIITGPLWLPKYLPSARYFPTRLDVDSVDDFIKIFGKVDYLFAGHEYFDKDNYVNAFLKVSNKLISYQGNTYKYCRKSYDAERVFLFCYSDQMISLYKDQLPKKVLSYHSGVDEICYLTEKPKNYLVWIGRIDTDKSPHYAALASKVIGIPLYILGESKYQKDYEEKYKYIFSDSNVQRKGVVYGPEKMKLLSEATCGIYTLGKDYTEAGAGVLGEILRSGIPLAAISWKGNDAVCEAVDDDRLGKVELINEGETEEQIVGKLVKSIRYCLELDRKEIYKLANEKYDPMSLAEKMFRIIDGK